MSIEWQFEEEQEGVELGSLRDAMEAYAVGAVSREFVLAQFGIDPEAEMVNHIRELQLQQEMEEPVLSGLSDSPCSGEDVEVIIRRDVRPDETYIEVDSSLGDTTVYLPYDHETPTECDSGELYEDMINMHIPPTECDSGELDVTEGGLNRIVDEDGNVLFSDPNNHVYFRNGNICIEAPSTECESGREILELICTLCGNMAVVTVDGGGFMFADMELDCACGGTAVPNIGDAPTECTH